MLTEPFAPELTVNRVYNAILKRTIPNGTGLFSIGVLVRAQPMSDGRWTIDRPPFGACVTVAGEDLIPITSAE